MSLSTQITTTKQEQGRALSTNLPKQIQQAKTKTRRLMVSFWLDVSKQSEYDLNEHIRMLKKERMFSYSIRAGLALLRDLRQGNLDVLCEMFPWVKEKLQPQTEVLRELQMLRQLMLERGGEGIPSSSNITKPIISLPQPKAEVKAAASVSADAIADNFLSMFQ